MIAKNLNIGKIVIIFLIAILIAYIILNWIIKLEDLPGLHGDEAWSGIKAFYFLRQPIVQFTGMTSYTGILQPIISCLIFKFLGTGVIQLRYPTVFFNTLGVVIFCYCFFKKGQNLTALIFLGILSQSVLYLTSPRIAWEVNTFTLFFSSIIFFSIIKIDENFDHGWWIFVFLITNLFGSYNHIIFSSLSFAAFIGVLLLRKNLLCDQYQRIMTVLFVNLINLAVLFVIMRYFNLLNINNAVLIVSMIGLILTETLLYMKVRSFNKFPRVIFPSFLVKSILVVFIGTFVIFHGKSFFELHANYKLLLQVYSLQSARTTELLLCTLSLIFLSYVGYFLWTDLRSSTSSVIGYLILTYMGILNLYTTQTSFRYYLLLDLIFFLYLSWKITTHIKICLPLICSFLISFATIGILHFRILSTEYRPVKPFRFNIGNSQIETSAHFLSKVPIIHFLQENRIENIRTTQGDPFFINEPIKFYKLYIPWRAQKNSFIYTEYNFESIGSGYIFYYPTNY